MAILQECPYWHLRQSIANKQCTKCKLHFKSQKVGIRSPTETRTANKNVKALHSLA
jgi:hypothetical protein